MQNKDFETNVYLNKAPNFREVIDKSVKTTEVQNNRVDINVLKAIAKAIQDKENIKYTIVIVLFLIAIGTIGIYFSI